MDERRWRAVAASLAVALLILGVLLFVVGGRRVFDAILAADPPLVAATIGLALCWLFAWSLMLWTVLGTLGVSLPVGTAFYVYAGAVFANNVTPFGQAGGEPIAAALVSKAADSRYEVGLASVASVDVVNVAASIAIVLVGVGYRATTVAIGDRLLTAVASAIVVVAGVGVLLWVGWRRRGTIVERVAVGAGAITTRIGWLPDDGDRVETAVAERLSHFFVNLELVGADRRRLTVVLALSLAGWGFQAAALLAAFAAVGHTAPALVVLFVIPLANLAGAAPLPGGLGGIEAAFVALLVPTTGIPAAAVTAAVLIYRVAIYWLPTLLGGATTTLLGVRSTAE